MVVEMLSTSPAKDSTVSRMVSLVEEASMKRWVEICLVMERVHFCRSETEQLVERIAAVYTPIICLVALLLASIPFAYGTEVGLRFLEIALVLLVVSCPCALVISTPITYVCALASMAKKGILVKGGRYIEALGGKCKRTHYMLD